MMDEGATRQVACRTCGSPFEQKVGRGRKTPHCPVCRVEAARIRSAMRAFAVMAASMIEVSQMMGATLTRMRQEVADRQEGRCATCDRKRRRLFLKETGPELVGRCIECFMRGVYGESEDGGQVAG